MEGVTDYEAIARRLTETGEYRILRRIHPRDHYADDDGTPKKIGVVLDVETTGLDPAKDEIIELAMIKFEFSADGRIFRVLDTFSKLREPSVPISAEITVLTGISTEDVEGQAIDPEHVAAFVADAAIIIAHNAGFDRKFCERAWPCFERKAWACSIEEVDWRAEGFEGSRLGYLLAGCGLFHDGHRAAADCQALLEVLSLPLPHSEDLALKQLLDAARKPTVRVWAQNSPFDLKEVLKARGYRWNDGSDGMPRSWWVDIPEERLAEEQVFLRKEVYSRDHDVLWKRITAFDRYSRRV